MQTSYLYGAVLCAFVLGCSGNRDDPLNTTTNTAKADGGQVIEPNVPDPPLPPTGTPSRSTQLGVSGGKTSSTHYRARVVLNFPQAASTNRAPHYQVRLTRGGQP